MTDERRHASRFSSRRDFLGSAALVGAVGAATIAAPHVRNAEAAQTTTWKVQTSWPAGVGLATFKEWSGTIK